jgi:hypothetical protein
MKTLISPECLNCKDSYTAIYRGRILVINDPNKYGLTSEEQIIVDSSSSRELYYLNGGVDELIMSPHPRIAAMFLIHSPLCRECTNIPQIRE